MQKHITSMADAAGITEDQARRAFDALVDGSVKLYWDNDDPEIGNSDPEDILEDVWPVGEGEVVTVRYGLELGLKEYEAFIDEDGVTQWREML